MMIFCVKVYVNKEMVYGKSFYDLEEAVNFANSKEDEGYICEIERYDFERIISRCFWREAKNGGIN